MRGVAWGGDRLSKGSLLFSYWFSSRTDETWQFRLFNLILCKKWLSFHFFGGVVWAEQWVGPNSCRFGGMTGWSFQRMKEEVARHPRCLLAQEIFLEPGIDRWARWKHGTHFGEMKLAATVAGHLWGNFRISWNWCISRSLVNNRVEGLEKNP